MSGELLRVHVDATDTAGPYSTVRVGMGSTDDGRRVVFVGDARMMHRIEAALRDGQPITATVPTWAVLAATLPQEGNAP